MPNLTLAITAQRIIDGEHPQVAIKEHIDEWNRSFDPALYTQEAPMTGLAYADAWLAAAAEYEAFMIDLPCPAWADAPTRFLSEPFYTGARRAQTVTLVETPFAFRRRLLFTGKTFIRGKAR